MPNPNSGTLDLGGPISPFLPARPAECLHSARPTTRLRKTVRELAISFLAWRAKRQTVRLLQSLDAATLRDLGITDIESAVHGDPRDRVPGYDPDWWRKAR
jgi:uncharacterized protein YjiS (DUF1127 family)